MQSKPKPNKGQTIKHHSVKVIYQQVARKKNMKRDRTTNSTLKYEKNINN